MRTLCKSRKKRVQNLINIYQEVKPIIHPMDIRRIRSISKPVLGPCVAPVAWPTFVLFQVTSALCALWIEEKLYHYYPALPLYIFCMDIICTLILSPSVRTFFAHFFAIFVVPLYFQVWYKCNFGLNLKLKHALKTSCKYICTSMQNLQIFSILLIDAKLLQN